MEPPLGWQSQDPTFPGHFCFLRQSNTLQTLQAMFLSNRQGACRDREKLWQGERS